jgi:DNA repair exonuclease SbcCD nuclease subunit
MPNLRTENSLIAGYVTDIHLKDGSYGRRKEANLSDFQLDVLSLVIEKIKSMGGNNLLLGGDLGDSYSGWSVKTLNRLISLFQNISVFTVVGNHDMKGNNLDYLSETGLGVLQHTPNFNILPTGTWTEIQEGVLVYPFHYGTTDAKAIENNMFFFETEGYDKPLRIGVAHIPVGPTETPYCKGVKSLDPVGFDCLLLGDQHQGHPTVISKSGCKIVNPGAMTLLGRDEAERIPGMALLWKTPENDLIVTYEELPKGEFKDNTPQKKVISADSFLTELVKIKQTTRLRGKDLVEYLGKEKKFDENIIQFILSKMK